MKDLETSKYKRESKGRVPIKKYSFIFVYCVLFGFLNIIVKKKKMKTLLQMEMYYVRECTPTCRLIITYIDKS